MQKQTLSECEFSVDQIENIVQRVLIELRAIQGFKYEDLLKEKVGQFAKDYKKKNVQQILNHSKEPFKLSLLFKTQPITKEQNIPQSQLQNQSKPIKSVLMPPNIFLYSFQLPCNYATYQQMIKNAKIQTKIDDIISSYEVKQELGQNQSIKAEVVQLSYKRVLIISPRQFVYVRIFYKEKNKNQSEDNLTYWILTFSIPYEKKTDKTTAQIILTAQKVQENHQKTKIKIKVYSEVDMKTVVKPDMAKNKGFAEIKKYVQKLYDYSKKL